MTCWCWWWHFTCSVTNVVQCQVVDDACLHCPSPAVTERQATSRRSLRSRLYNISFTMDAVEEVQDLHRYFPSINASFAVVSDPVYTSFGGGLRVYKGEALILTVRILSSNSQYYFIIFARFKRIYIVQRLRIFDVKHYVARQKVNVFVLWIIILVWRHKMTIKLEFTIILVYIAYIEYKTKTCS